MKNEDRFVLSLLIFLAVTFFLFFFFMLAIGVTKLDAANIEKKEVQARYQQEIEKLKYYQTLNEVYGSEK